MRHAGHPAGQLPGRWPRSAQAGSGLRVPGVHGALPQRGQLQGEGGGSDSGCSDALKTGRPLKYERNSLLDSKSKGYKYLICQAKTTKVKTHFNNTLFYGFVVS